MPRGPSNTSSACGLLTRWAAAHDSPIIIIIIIIIIININLNGLLNVVITMNQEFYLWFLYSAQRRATWGPSGLHWWILPGASRWTRQPHPRTSEGEKKQSGEWLDMAGVHWCFMVVLLATSWFKSETVIEKVKSRQVSRYDFWLLLIESILQNREVLTLW